MTTSDHLGRRGLKLYYFEQLKLYSRTPIAIDDSRLNIKLPPTWDDLTIDQRAVYTRLVEVVNQDTSTGK